MIWPMAMTTTTLAFVLCLFTTCHGEIMFQLMQGQQLRDWEHLLSPRGTFKLGFFSPASSSYRYLGIWYSKLPHNPEAIWVGNPGNPILNSSGVLTLDFDGRLKITQNGGQAVVVSSNLPEQGNVTLILLDTGNLVLTEVGSGGSVSRVLWKSFDYPTNQLLPGMKLGLDRKTGENWTLTSWLSNKDPALGAFRLGVDPGDINQLVVWKRDSVYWTSGPWQDNKFQMARELTSKPDLYEFTFVSNMDEKYFTFTMKKNTTVSRWEISLWGQIVQSALASDGTTWQYSTTSSCSSNGNYSNAICIDQKPSQCRNGSELFTPQRGYYNSGNLLYSDNNSSLIISDCHSICWNNCSCVAFGSLFNDGTGCEFWSEGASFVSNENFDELYVLTSTTSPDESTHSGTKKKWWVWLIVVAVSVAVAMLLGCLLYMRRKTHELARQSGQSAENPNYSSREIKPKILPSRRFAHTETIKQSRKNKGSEIHMFRFSEVETATNYFSLVNKLGEGGFGPVYQGVLTDGQQIAVKRLARNSGQGIEEFMNEITLIAELQHMNLVKLMGCCIQGEEKMLIYEYMPNKSLDSFLFDEVKKKELDWERRRGIIEGIAQGLLYLHKYSRLKVIHRDLKASNILLDNVMNPKISDFGMARIFGQNESKANTNRIVGTYGYMSPEYAMKGIFSVKSDVFSFGVLMLEIISGRKNNVVMDSSNPLGVIEQAWELWNQADILELVDTTLGSYPKNELLRAIHIGLLCVQEYPSDRPTISEVITLLMNENAVISDPKQPAYCIRKSGSGESSSGPDVNSVNGATITVIQAR